MKWTNLLKNKCPKCGRGLTMKEQPSAILEARQPGDEQHEIPKPGVLICVSKKCDFQVNESRFKEIVISITERKIDRRYY